MKPGLWGMRMCIRTVSGEHRPHLNHTASAQLQPLTTMKEDNNGTMLPDFSIFKENLEIRNV